MSDYQGGGVHRRGVLCGGGAAMLSAIMATLGGAKPVRAEAISGSVAEIDHIAVRVVVDSYQFAVAPSRKRQSPGHRSRRARRPRIEPWPLRSFWRSCRLPAGKSRQAKSQAASICRRRGGVLLTGVDSTTGARRLWRARSQGPRGCEPSGDPAEGPALVGGLAFTTGQIGQTSFEKLLSPSAMKVGVDHGIGCCAEKLPQDERTKSIIPDQFRHEIATAFNLRGRGLIILTSCSHRGVINAIKQAQAVSGVNKVHAVIGGFHLALTRTTTCVRR
jgi:hypothetical protein